MSTRRFGNSSSGKRLIETLRWALRRGDILNVLKQLAKECNEPLELQMAAEEVGCFYMYGHDEFVVAADFVATVEAESQLDICHRWDKARRASAELWLLSNEVPTYD